jgi:hypothetical protein
MLERPGVVPGPTNLIRPAYGGEPRGRILQPKGSLIMPKDIKYYAMDMHAVDAENWLLQYPFERQRNIRPHHVQFLAHLMEHHRFRPYSTLDMACLKGKKYLVNGYHTLSAIVRCQQMQPVLVIEREVRSMAEVAQLYTTFDRHLSRTPFDMLQAYGFPEQYAFTKDQNAALLAAVKVVLSGFVWASAGAGAGRIYLNDQEILYTAVCDWLPEAAQFFEDIAGAPDLIRRGLIRAGALAAALVAYRFQAGMAEEYWTMVAEDSAPHSDHPAKTCTHYLISTSVKQAKGTIRYARAMAQCWNAFAGNRRLGNVRVADIATPMRLDGTPHDGRAVWRYVSAQWEVQHNPVEFDEPFFHRFRKGSLL